MYVSHNTYPEQIYAIAADRVRAMRDAQTVQQARRARREQRLRRIRATLWRLGARK